MINTPSYSETLNTNTVMADVSLPILAYIGIQCKSMLDNLDHDYNTFIYDKTLIAATAAIASSAFMILCSSYLYKPSTLNYTAKSHLDNDYDDKPIDFIGSSISPINTPHALEVASYQNSKIDDLPEPILDTATNLDDMITYTDSYERTHLHNACIKGDYGLVKYLISKGLDVNKGDDEGITPLQYASMQEHVYLIELLIKNGADVNRGDEQGYTALHYACWNGYISVARYLIECGASVNLKDVDGNTPLDNAIAKSRQDVVNYLIKNGGLSRKSSDDENDLTEIDTEAPNQPSNIAIESQKIYLNDLIPGTSIDPDLDAEDGYTTLHKACRDGNLNAVKSLITQGCEIDLQDEEGCSPLHYAALNGSVDIARYLINNGANINILDQSLMSPLHYAAFYNKIGIAELLIQKGADTNLKDITGKTPLRYAFDDDDLVLCFYNTKPEHSVSEEELKEFSDCNDNPSEEKYWINHFSEYTKDLVDSASRCYSVISDEVANFYNVVISSPANSNFAAGIMAGILGGVCLSFLAPQCSVASIFQPNLIPAVNIIGPASLLADAIYYELPKAFVELGM